MFISEFQVLDWFESQKLISSYLKILSEGSRTHQKSSQKISDCQKKKKDKKSLVHIKIKSNQQWTPVVLS